MFYAALAALSMNMKQIKRTRAEYTVTVVQKFHWSLAVQISEGPPYASYPFPNTTQNEYRYQNDYVQWSKNE
jgi:hypothetical protein